MDFISVVRSSFFFFLYICYRHHGCWSLKAAIMIMMVIIIIIKDIIFASRSRQPGARVQAAKFCETALFLASPLVPDPPLCSQWIARGCRCHSRLRKAGNTAEDERMVTMLFPIDLRAANERDCLKQFEATKLAASRIRPRDCV